MQKKKQSNRIDKSLKYKCIVLYMEPYWFILCLLPPPKMFGQNIFFNRCSCPEEFYYHWVDRHLLVTPFFSNFKVCKGPFFQFWKTKDMFASHWNWNWALRSLFSHHIFHVRNVWLMLFLPCSTVIKCKGIKRRHGELASQAWIFSVAVWPLCCRLVRNMCWMVEK